MTPPDRDFGAPVWARMLDPRPGGEPRRSPAWADSSGAPAGPPPSGAPEGCPLPWDWERKEYVALDFETTGLEPERDRVVEIGALPFGFDAEGAIVTGEAFVTVVNPLRPIPREATRIHGITDLEASAGPTFAGIAPDLPSLLAGRVLVAHNASFDIGFLRSEFSRAGIPLPSFEIVDTLALARLAFPSFMSYSLGKVAFRLRIDTGTSHRAGDDAAACMRIFAACARVLAGKC